MGKYKITYDKNRCTGALSCVGINADLWVPTPDGKVELKGSKETKKGVFELLIDEKDFDKNKNAVKVCPPGAIKIEPAK